MDYFNTERPTPNFDSRLDPDTDPAWRDAPPDEDLVTCDQCECQVPDKDCVGLRGVVLCWDCYGEDIDVIAGREQEAAWDRKDGK
jgi:hypothetical protein